MKLLLTYPNCHDSDRRAVIGDMLKRSEETVTGRVRGEILRFLSHPNKKNE